VIQLGQQCHHRFAITRKLGEVHLRFHIQSYTQHQAGIGVNDPSSRIHNCWGVLSPVQAQLYAWCSNTITCFICKQCLKMTLSRVALARMLHPQHYCGLFVPRFRWHLTHQTDCLERLQMSHCPLPVHCCQLTICHH
jgi:hypothetical protein